MMKPNLRPAFFLLIAVYILVGIGIVMTYSASAVYADQIYDNPQHFLLRQIIYAMIGTLVLFATASVPLCIWKDHARFFILLAIILLVMVFLPVLGRTAGGAQRWLHFGAFNLQPAEYAKIAVCLYLSDYLTRKKKTIHRGSLSIFFPPLFLIGCVCLLILLQPDLGSTAFIFMIVAVMIFLAGIRMKYVLIATTLFLPVFYLLIIRVPYRLSRVTAYLNPWEDPQGSGFQIIQSFLAFGLGGIKGVGLGQSMQKLFYLPSSYNDFIFSIIGEELGLIGALWVIALYAIIFICGFQISKTASQPYEKMLILSMTLTIVLQALINMMVATGLVPTKGLPLPFVSFGGTSLIFNFMALGIIMSIERSIRGGRKL